MIQRGQNLRFALETREPVGIEREGFRKNFERDLAIELRVPRAEYLAHAARSEQRYDFVRADQGAGCERHARSIRERRRTDAPFRASSRSDHALPAGTAPSTFAAS